MLGLLHRTKGIGAFRSPLLRACRCPTHQGIGYEGAVNSASKLMVEITALVYVDKASGYDVCNGSCEILLEHALMSILFMSIQLEFLSTEAHVARTVPRQDFKLPGDSNKAASS